MCSVRSVTFAGFEFCNVTYKPDENTVAKQPGTEGCHDVSEVDTGFIYFRTIRQLVMQIFFIQPTVYTVTVME